MQIKAAGPGARLQDARPVGEMLAALRIFAAVADRLVSLARALPDEPETAKMLRRLGAEASAPKDPPANFLEVLRRELAAASLAKRLYDLSRKQRRYIPWLLWSRDKPVATLPGVLEMVLNEARESRSTLRRLIQVFLRDFDPRAPGIGQGARRIQQGLNGADDPRLAHWRLAQKEVQLFDPLTGPRKLATKLLHENNPEIVLSSYRFDDPILAAGGYMMAVEDAVREVAPAMLRNGGTGVLERIVRILAPDEQLRSPARRAETARAFLAAWLTGSREPEPSLQQPVRQWLLKWVGDPRLHQQRWTAVGEKETALMRRWLARASLDLFFRLIDRQNPTDRHWRYRRAFWFAYLERGAISDAWLALGAGAYRSAEVVRELGRAYGRLVGESTQSALLLRIGPLVISEFTNIGKVRAWLNDWSEAPQLGQAEYYKWDLMGKCLPFPPNPYRGKGGSPNGTGLSHINSHEGYWQGSAAALIERQTGIKITAVDWQPR
jgi:EH_Signature domain